MFNPSLYFQTLDLTKTKVLLNMGLESFVIWAYDFQRLLTFYNYSPVYRGKNLLRRQTCYSSVYLDKMFF